MSEKSPQKSLPALFSKENFYWMIAGGILIALGMLLMTGGKNADPGTFDTDLVYGARRITLGPIVIVAGLLIEVYAIFKTPKAKQS